MIKTAGVNLGNSDQVLSHALVLSPIDTHCLKLQIEEWLILSSKLIQDVVIGNFLLARVKTESDFSLLLLEHFANAFLFDIKRSRESKEVENSSDIVEAMGADISRPSLKNTAFLNIDEPILWIDVSIDAKTTIETPWETSDWSKPVILVILWLPWETEVINWHQVL